MELRVFFVFIGSPLHACSCAQPEDGQCRPPREVGSWQWAPDPSLLCQFTANCSGGGATAGVTCDLSQFKRTVSA
jgi:hypothetical protein